MKIRTLAFLILKQLHPRLSINTQYTQPLKPVNYVTKNT